MAQYPDLQQLQKLANSPEGRQLMAALQQYAGNETRQAADLAAGGDWSKAKQCLSEVLSTPQIQKLLAQLEDRG